jgi:hypothetical protein
VLGSNLVTTYAQNTGGEADYKVAVDIRRFVSMGNAVSVEAFWSIRRAAKGTLNFGRSRISETRNGAGYDALVAAYNRAIASVGNDIAKAISSDWGDGR